MKPHNGPRCGSSGAERPWNPHQIEARGGLCEGRQIERSTRRRASGGPDATGRGSCRQRRKRRRAPLRSALTVTAPLSAAGARGRDEGRDFDGVRRVEQRAGAEASNGLVPFTRNELGELIGALARD